VPWSVITAAFSRRIAGFFPERLERPNATAHDFFDGMSAHKSDP